MTKYELLYILDASLTEEVRKSTIEKIKKFAVDDKAENVEVAEWGIKKYAYPIKFKNEGYYVLMTFASSESFPAKLSAQLLILESVVRHMFTIKK